MPDFLLPRQTSFYRGKVRDVYTIDDKWLVMITSDRISAFDVILPRPIPFKGQVLNQLAAFVLGKTKDICPNWLFESPAPNISVGRKCKPFAIEMVVRGNLAGHAWRTYSSGKRELCGEEMSDGMKENDFFPSPIITPSTKAMEGHDEDISAEEIIRKKLATEDEWKALKNISLKLFERGKKIASARGLILVDTKYEFGKLNDQLCLIDEIHTPDSSRYFYADGFEERQKRSEHQPQLSKEFVREWLIANDFMGKEGQQVPPMSDEWVDEISKKYITLYEKITGEKFKPEKLSDKETYSRIVECLGRLE